MYWLNNKCIGISRWRKWILSPHKISVISNSCPLCAKLIKWFWLSLVYKHYWYFSGLLELDSYLAIGNSILYQLGFAKFNSILQHLTYIDYWQSYSRVADKSFTNLTSNWSLYFNEWVSHNEMVILRNLCLELGVFVIIKLNWFCRVSVSLFFILYKYPSWLINKTIVPLNKYTLITSNLRREIVFI